MERVGIVVLSIALATAVVVGASYGAIWLAPYLDDMPSPWPLIGFATLFPAAVWIVRHRRKRARPLA
jgi:F0F1-type ATP synthase assembly protein I